MSGGHSVAAAGHLDRITPLVRRELRAHDLREVEVEPLPVARLAEGPDLGRQVGHDGVVTRHRLLHGKQATGWRKRRVWDGRRPVETGDQNSEDPVQLSASSGWGTMLGLIRVAKI